MANIVPSLFGVTPQAYQQAQQQRADEQAMAFARLTPIEKASFGVQRGAYDLAGAIGGALGGQDPELQRITRRQQIASQIDFSSPASIQQAMNMLGDDAEGAMMLQAELRKAQMGQAELESQQALTQQRLREKQGEDPVQQLLRTGKFSPKSVSDYQKSGEISDLKPLDSAMKTQVVETANGQLLIDMGSGQTIANLGTAPDRRAVTSVTNVLPGERVKPKDWMDFTQNVLSKDPVMARTSTILSDAPSAIDIIRTSTENDISAAALPGSLARLTGEGKNMSNEDVKRFARTGGLDDRLAGDAVKFFTGKGTKVRKEQAERFATALYRGALIQRKEKLANEAEQYGYLDSPNYKIALRQIDDQLGQFKLKTRGDAKTPTSIPTQPGRMTDAELLNKYSTGQK